MSIARKSLSALTEYVYHFISKVSCKQHVKFGFSNTFFSNNLFLKHFYRGYLQPLLSFLSEWYVRQALVFQCYFFGVSSLLSLMNGFMMEWTV